MVQNLPLSDNTRQTGSDSSGSTIGQFLAKSRKGTCMQSIERILVAEVPANCQLYSCQPGGAMRSLLWVALFGLLFPASRVAYSQTPPDQLHLNAVLVLPADFCTKKISGRAVGKATCAELEPALRKTFTGLTTSSVPSQTADHQTQAVLVPRMISFEAEGSAFTPANATIEFEWTVKDGAGAIVWVGQVRGISAGKRVTAFTASKELNLLTQEAAKEVALKTVLAITAASEVKNLAALPQRSLEETSGNPTLTGTAANTPAVAVPATQRANPNRYTIEFAHTEKTWKHNLRKTSYDDLSADLRELLSAELARKGFERAASSDRTVARLTVGILTANLVNDSVLKLAIGASPGVNVTATVEVADVDGKSLFKREYA
jgi:hypothetical protein